ncbi:hypothetical protein GCM10027184_25670 [Saccharothrix stipae]
MTTITTVVTEPVTSETRACVHTSRSNVVSPVNRDSKSPGSVRCTAGTRNESSRVASRFLATSTTDSAGTFQQVVTDHRDRGTGQRQADQQRQQTGDPVTRAQPVHQRLGRQRLYGGGKTAQQDERPSEKDGKPLRSCVPQERSPGRAVDRGAHGKQLRLLCSWLKCDPGRRKHRREPAPRSSATSHVARHRRTS